MLPRLRGFRCRPIHCSCVFQCSTNEAAQPRQVALLIFRRRKLMRKFLFIAVALTWLALPAAAQTADEIIAKYIKTIGGMEKLQAIKTLRRQGKYNGGGGFEAVYVQINKRPGQVRQEFTFQGMTGSYAYDGKT